MSMTGRQRVLAAIRGEAVDRVPIWLGWEWYFHEPLPPEDHFTSAWKNKPEYRRVFDHAAQYCDTLHPRSGSQLFNRFAMVQPNRIKHEDDFFLTPDIQVHRGWLDVPGSPRRLTFENQTRRNVATVWGIEAPVQSLEELDALMSAPWEVDAAALEASVKRAFALDKQIGDRGLMRFSVSSPLIMISSVLSMQDFLESLALEEAYIHTVMEEVTRRVEVCIDALFPRLAGIDMLINVGGSEQCVPPLVSPDLYDRLVIPYEKRIVQKLKHTYGLPCNAHCHGRVRHALKGMLEIGFDSTDPVEIPPDGDVTLAEAREIVGGRMTLIGNIEFYELEFSTPEQIRERVREIMREGPRRLIVGTSGGPLTDLSPRLEANYIALIDEAVKI